MKTRRGTVCLAQAALIFFAALSFAVAQQKTPEVRRAQPVDEPPPRKAFPFDPRAPSAKPRRSPPDPTVAPKPRADEPEGPATEPEASDRRQLDYANGLFSRKLFDLAAPEYEKFLGQYPGASGRPSAYFYLAECYRALNKTSAARSSFQNVLDNYGESEFAGPAAYGIAEILL